MNGLPPLSRAQAEHDLDNLRLASVPGRVAEAGYELDADGGVRGRDDAGGRPCGEGSGVLQDQDPRVWGELCRSWC